MDQSLTLAAAVDNRPVAKAKGLLLLWGVFWAVDLALSWPVEHAAALIGVLLLARFCYGRGVFSRREAGAYALLSVFLSLFLWLTVPIAWLTVLADFTLIGLVSLSLPINSSTFTFVAITLFVDLALVATHPLRRFPDYAFTFALNAGLLLPPFCLCLLFPNAPCLPLPLPPPVPPVIIPQQIADAVNPALLSPDAAARKDSVSQQKTAKRLSISKEAAHAHATRRISGEGTRQRVHSPSSPTGGMLHTAATGVIPASHMPPSSPSSRRPSALSVTARVPVSPSKHGRKTSSSVPKSPSSPSEGPLSEPGSPTFRPLHIASASNAPSSFSLNQPSVLGVAWAAQAAFSYISAFRQGPQNAGSASVRHSRAVTNASNTASKQSTPATSPLHSRTTTGASLSPKPPSHRTVSANTSSANAAVLTGGLPSPSHTPAPSTSSAASPAPLVQTQTQQQLQQPQASAAKPPTHSRQSSRSKASVASSSLIPPSSPTPPPPLTATHTPAASLSAPPIPPRPITPPAASPSTAATNLSPLPPFHPPSRSTSPIPSPAPNTTAGAVSSAPLSLSSLPPSPPVSLPSTTLTPPPVPPRPKSPSPSPSLPSPQPATSAQTFLLSSVSQNDSINQMAAPSPNPAQSLAGANPEQPLASVPASLNTAEDASSSVQNTQQTGQQPPQQQGEPQVPGETWYPGSGVSMSQNVSAVNAANSIVGAGNTAVPSPSGRRSWRGRFSSPRHSDNNAPNSATPNTGS